MNFRKCIKLFVIVAMLGMVCCGCGLFKTKIDLTNYISYSYEGINGYTPLVVSLDKEAVRADYMEEVGEKNQEAFNLLIDSLEVEASKNDGLVNGDLITINVKFSEEDCETAKVKFAGEVLEITVEGLREGELLDLFADVNVNVSGIAPFATASIENKSANAFVQGLSYSLDVTEGFREGDVLTVTCQVDEDVAGDAGYVVLETIEKFSTAGIPYYVETTDKLDMAVVNEVVEEAKATVLAETEGSQTRMLYKVTGSTNFLFQYNKEWIDSIELAEVRLLTLSDTGLMAQGYPYNKLWIVFKAYVTNADHGSDGYFCFEYTDIVKNADGTMSVKRDNPALRYICDDDYNQLMEAAKAKNNGVYLEQMVESVQTVVQ